jgi:hypothetical protein
MDRRKIFGEQFIADDHALLGASDFSDAHGLSSELGRSEIAGGRVGEVAGEEHRTSKPLDVAVISAVGPDESRRRTLLDPVAGKGIGREGPTESQPRRIDAVGRDLEPVAPFG